MAALMTKYDIIFFSLGTKIMKQKFFYSLLLPMLLALLQINCMNELYMGERPSSEPYISGDTFRKYCDHIFDVKEQNFDPSTVNTGDLIFVGPRDYDHSTLREAMNDFFKNYHPLIKNKYILITHNSDLNITDEFFEYLESEKLFVWFAQNVKFVHPKLKPLPIGLENALWRRNYADTISRLMHATKTPEKKYLLYMNFSVSTNPAERGPVYNYFKGKDFCYSPDRLNTEKYLHEITQAKFILSPHGNGLDCHRTWEALYLGVIPVVKKSTLDPLYEGLPVLIVDDWCDLTEDFLEQKYIEMMSRSYRTEKLYIHYWLDILKKYKIACKE
jgi:hypothetical protein